MNDTPAQITEEPLPAAREPGEFLVVGIGASAGGLQALQAFFECVPANSGIAYVVILHLSPDHDSQLAQILQNACAIPVTQVTSSVHVERDHVYVVPPDRHLTMRGEHIIVAQNTTMQDRRAPVDIFFRTLAESHGPRAVCVVLSGTGANGSMGLKRVKERGGAAFVQNPHEAEFDEMPRHSIETGLVDAVLPVAAIAERILDYKTKLGGAEIPLDPERRSEEHQQALREIFTLLRARTGHDFTNYKRATLLRRIQRRINVRGLPDVPAYAAYVRDYSEETQALLKDLLISVTNFFRDARAFGYLNSGVLERLVKDKRANEQLRIWVIGCATGEEAYSLAMACAEHTAGVIDAPKVQIFATDIDADAIAHAREALYTLNDAADVSAERLARFFLAEGDGFRIRREIREMVLFAKHNVLKDPPFSHVDLVTCRNVLIYLDDLAQERVLETAHFALNPGGFLFVGTSETVEHASDLFVSASREHHVFQARAAGSRRFPVPAPRDAHHERVHLPEAPPRPTVAIGERIAFGDLHQQLLERYAPPSLLVNDEFEVMHLSENVGRYLQVPGGEPSNHIFKLIRDELRLELRTALYQAAQRRTNVEARGITVNTEYGTETVNIHVRPVVGATDSARGFALVVFEPGTAPPPDEERVFASDEPVSRQLEEELIRVKLQLRTTNEQHEIQEEELKASNEELHAVNEELRSAAEELETSREELQSINEELTTVNQELSVKLDELSESSNNLQNLINSTDIATIFLDRRLRVNLFSPAVRRIYNLVPTDVGRPLSDITHRLAGVELSEEAATVLETLELTEREVVTDDGQTFLMRLRPYRTGDDRIEGVVATFTDIAARKRDEEAIAADLRDTTLLRELALSFVPEDDVEKLYGQILSAAIALTHADAGTVQILDDQTDELALLASAGFSDEMKRRFQRVDASSKTPCGAALARNSRAVVDFDAPGTADPDGSLRAHVEAGYLSAQSTPLLSRTGKAIGMVTTHWREHRRPAERELRFLDLLMRQAADVIQQQRVQSALRTAEQRFRTLVQNVHDHAIFMIDPHGLVTEWTDGAERLTGYSAEEAYGQHFWFFYSPEETTFGKPGRDLAAALATGRSETEGWRVRKSGERFLVNEIVTPIRNGEGRLEGFATISRDITDRRRTEAAYRLSEERLRLTLEAVTDYAIFTLDPEGRIDSWPPGAQQTFGYGEEEARGQHSAILYTPEDRAASVPEQEMRTAVERGRAADERWHLRKDGTRFYVSGVVAPLRHDGVLTGFAKVARDLTRQKLAEDELARARDELEQRVQERTQALAAANESLRREAFERQRVEDARVFLLRELVNAQEDERRRISRELHDQLGQQVSALGLKLAMLKRDETLPGPARAEIERLESLSKQLDSDLDFLVWELRPTALDDLGLVEALSDYAENWSSHFGIGVDVRAPDMDDARLGPEIETVVYRMAQEALNNVAKHARAKRVQIDLARGDGHVSLTVVDDGVGFDVRQPFGTGAKGLGLVGMRERAALAGGSVAIESKPGAGTTVVLQLPASADSRVSGRRGGGADEP